MNIRTNSSFISSILVQDRVGLLKDVTEAVFSLEGNIGAIRQTLVDGFFSLVFTSTHPQSVTQEALKSTLKSVLEESAVISVQEREKSDRESTNPSKPRYIVITRGKDKPGTICAISSFMVENGINIEDWLVEEEGGNIIYIAQVHIPGKVDFHNVQNKFKKRMATIGLTGLLCHENIFRATNEIGPIKALIG
ncbi:MAG: hypothetical protein R6V06_01985 [Kiritimatiellia bacterium]